ncbi:ABC transporter permease [Arthrobacter sp. UYEF3]|uniref:ABC transporter permease n=1 Tax=Arthrobacter sp. UYEF3 TaxID=1756365 RepID=UPI003394D99B
MLSKKSTLFLLAPGLIFIVAGFCLPALTMLLAPPGVTTGQVFDRMLRLLQDPYDLAIIGRTVGLGLLVTALSLLLGFPIALLLARSTSRWSGLLLALAIFPLLLSNVVRTYGWLVLLGQNGVIGQIFSSFGLPAPQLLYTETAIILGLLQLFLPLAVISCYSAVAQVDAGLDEAAQGLGASRTRVLWTVTLPLSLPGVVVAATLVFAGSITAYTTPYLLGGSTHRTLATQLFNYATVSIDWAAASAVAIVMTVLVFLVSAVSSAIGSRKGSIS